MNALQGAVNVSAKERSLCHDSTVTPQYEKTTPDNCKQTTPKMLNTQYQIKWQ